MDKLNYTQGPWGMGSGFTNTISIYPENGSNAKDICDVRDNYGEENRGNVSLIVHAPEMYELLKKHLETAEHENECRDSNGKLYPAYREMQLLLDRVETEGRE